MAKWKLAVTELDAAVNELIRSSQHKTLAIWAADCAERVLPHFEQQFPDDDRPRKAIEACREWARSGVFRMAAVRGASLAAHAAAREAAEGSAARSAARAAGQAMAVAHVPTHAIAAAIYAATAVRDAAEPGQAAAVALLGEREWQYRHLLALREGRE